MRSAEDKLQMNAGAGHKLDVAKGEILEGVRIVDQQHNTVTRLIDLRKCLETLDKRLVI